jgi:hypothetical protein
LQYTNKSLKNYAKLPSLSYELYIQYIQQWVFFIFFSFRKNLLHSLFEVLKPTSTLSEKSWSFFLTHFASLSLESIVFHVNTIA